MSVELKYSEPVFEPSKTATLLRIGAFISAGLSLYELIRYAVQWLKMGAAELVTLSSLLNFPETGWVGLKKLINIIGQIPLVVVGGVVTFYGLKWAFDYDEKAHFLEQARMKASKDIK
jgi:hypothetical protein